MRQKKLHRQELMPCTYYFTFSGAREARTHCTLFASVNVCSTLKCVSSVVLKAAIMHQLVSVITIAILFSPGITASFVVYPSVVESRGLHEHKVVRLDDNMTLTLRRSDFLRGKFITTYIQDGKWRQHVVNSAIFGLHEDTNKLSIVLMHELQNGVQLRGFLTPSLYIEPLYIMERSYGGRMAHKVSKVRETPHLHVEASQIQDSLTERSYWSNNPGPHLPATVWLELGVVCDYEHWKSFSNTEDHRTYMILFMRSVTLRFNFHTPKIQFIFRNLYLLEKTQSDQMLGVEATSTNSADILLEAIDGEKVLENLKKHVAANQPNIDIAYLVTKRPNIKEYDEERKSYILVPGMTYEEGVCTKDNVALGWDDAKIYLGIEIAVRLVANMLGAPWDGDETEGCTSEEGYIMGNYMNFSGNSYQFSECSKKGMKEALRKRLQEDNDFKSKNPLKNSDESDERGCFGNAYEYRVDELGYDLPGTKVDQNEFCKAVMPMPDKENVHLCENWFENIQEWEAEQCVTRCCHGWVWTFYKQIAYKSLDGFKCYKSRKVCYAGECVKSGTNINTYG